MSTERSHRDDSDSQPPTKRQRVQEGQADDSREEDLSQLVLLDGDDFVTEEQKQEAEAQRRRLLRKQRLQKLQQNDEPPSASDSEMNDSQKIQSSQQQQARDTNQSIDQSRGPSEPKKPVQQADADENDAASNDSGDTDDFDMFSSSVSPVTHEPSTAAAASTKRGHEQEDWDDAEGYYKAVIGEVISFDNTAASILSDPPSSAAVSSSGGGSMSFRVSGVIGKGVFSTVLKCSTISNSTSVELPPVIAMKCIRHNETMVKAALNELRYLQRLKGSPGIVPLLLPTTSSPLEHRGHVIFAFAFMEYNLRDVLQKFGKGVGLSLQAVRSYFGQLLAAATHLQKHGIIHADLKPDNILVGSDFGVVQLADFGSAIDATMPEQNQPTPYLVSRFYRAPEIILGLTPTYAVDLWSLAVTVAELFLGDVLFRGKSNNEMLLVVMQHLGAFSNRVIRKHLVQCQRIPVLPRHFQQQGANYVFRQQTVDPVTGTAVHKILSLQQHGNNGGNKQKFPLATPLNHKLLKAKSAKDSRVMVVQFSDLLQKCLALDPSRRIALKEALRHEFFQASKSKDATN